MSLETLLPSLFQAAMPPAKNSKGRLLPAPLIMCVTMRIVGVCLRMELLPKDITSFKLSAGCLVWFVSDSSSYLRFYGTFFVSSLAAGLCVVCMFCAL